MAPGHERTPVLTVGTVVWLASELMFFSGLFAAYFTLRATAEGDWPPADVELEVLTSGLFTLGLVLSSGTMQLAVRAIAARPPARVPGLADRHPGPGRRLHRQPGP